MALLITLVPHDDRPTRAAAAAFRSAEQADLLDKVCAVYASQALIHAQTHLGDANQRPKLAAECMLDNTRAALQEMDRLGLLRDGDEPVTRALSAVICHMITTLGRSEARSVIQDKTEEISW